MTLNVKNEIEDILDDGKVIDRYNLSKEKGYSHGFLLEETSISVTCESSDSYDKSQPKVSRFGREVPENTEVCSNKKRSYKCSSEASISFLEDIFRINSYPTSKERHIIAKKCGLSPTQVGVWVRMKETLSTSGY